MRLILHHSLFDKEKIARGPIPDDTVSFWCFEEFSVGPLSQWHDRKRFYEDRAEFWRRTEKLNLPDGSQMDYFIWHQTLPRYDLVQMVESGIPVDDIPLPKDWYELAPVAKRVEIWHDETVCGQVFLWYTMAALNDLQISSERVSIRCLPDDRQTGQSPEFWSDMLWDRPHCAVPASPLSEGGWVQALRYWDAATKLPEPVDPSLLRGAKKMEDDALLTLSGRHPSEETGLTNLQTRLLRSTRHEWQRMVMTVSDAMIAGIEDGDPVGQTVLQAELNEMAKMTPPLVEVEGKGAIQFCRVRLTPFGEAEKLAQALVNPS